MSTSCVRHQRPSHLLLGRAMHLERQCDRERRCDETLFDDRLDDLSERNRLDDGVSVRDTRLAIRPIKAIELDAAATHEQLAPVPVHEEEALW